MGKKKIKSCRSAWGAYREAFANICRLYTLNPRILSSEEFFVMSSFETIVLYERSKVTRMHKHRCHTVTTPIRKRPDWYSYERAYGDAIYLYNRFHMLDDSRARRSYMKMPLEKRALMRVFLEIMNYACKLDSGNFDKQKARNFTRRLRHVMNKLRD